MTLWICHLSLCLAPTHCSFALYYSRLQRYKLKQDPLPKYRVSRFSQQSFNLSSSRYLFWLGGCLLDVYIFSDMGEKLINSVKSYKLFEYPLSEEVINFITLIESTISKRVLPMQLAAYYGIWDTKSKY